MSSTEHEVRDGAPPNDGPLGGPPGPSAETDRGPSGLPDPDGPEEQPLGPQETDPDRDDVEPGADAMPGIPSGGEEPPSAG